MPVATMASMWPYAQVLAFFVYNFLMYFVFEPVAMTCFNTTVEKLRLDPRITVRLGNDITGTFSELCMCHETWWSVIHCQTLNQLDTTMGVQRSMVAPSTWHD